MNAEAQTKLEEILKKEIESLTEEDKAFLRARRSYLKKAQLEEYDNVLNPKVFKKETKEDQTSEEETVKENAKPSKTN